MNSYFKQELYEMLPIESGSKICAENLRNLTKENEQTCSLNPETVSILGSVGAYCNKELCVKMVAKTNENSDYSDKLGEVSDGLRKRDAVCVDHTTSKRCKLSEEETSVVPSNANEEPQTKRNEFLNGNVVESTTDTNTVEARNLEENNWVVKVKVEYMTDSSEVLNVNNPPSGCGSCTPVDIKPTVKVEKADASSTSRQCCRFGIRCYRY